MIAPKRTLVIVAFSTLVGCASPSIPATQPDVTDHALRLYATSATLPLVTDLTGAYGLTFETQSNPFPATLNNLLEYDTPYIISNHLPTDATTLSLWAAPIAQDGIAVIVNPANPIENLSLDQLRAIYQGRIHHWRDLTGQDQDLMVLSRETGDSTRLEFERLVMGSRPTTFAARLVTSESAMLKLIATTPGAIGYVSAAFLDQTVKPIAINQIALTSDNITQNRYPLRSTLFIIGLAEPPQDSPYRPFIGWIQSPEGQKIVSRHYSPLLTPIDQ
ncbi:MAG: substrate-binding domain-containing protein [Anaerolineae bacterium]|jgi:hypothetical protein|nr:substrate-binding domain-containing protein [Anaerolineae bacterium]